MNTINGSLAVRICSTQTYIWIIDCDMNSRVVAEMTVEQVKTLRAMLEEALIGMEYGAEYVTHTRLNQ